MTAEEQAAVVILRDAYAFAGSPKGPACISVTCLRLATKRVFWPVLADEEFPLYCDPCAAWAAQVLTTCGVKYRDEALPPRPAPNRLITLED